MLRTPNAPLWTLLRPLLRLILRIRLGFFAPYFRAKTPFVLLCNHVSWYDPLLAAVCVNRPLCFVGADPAPRLGPLLSLARRLQQPDELGMDEALKQAGDAGECVGLFPEGTRCMDGRTGPIPAGLAAQIKASGLGLVTLRLSGAYLTAPRWADSIPRRGRVRVRLMRTLEPGMLQAIDTEELQSMIEQDLREDAFATAGKRPAPYRGERTAERLEKLLCICPKCGGVGSMESRDNAFTCRACGFSTVYTLSGGFRGGGVPFTDPGQWLRWQEERIGLLCGKADEKPIFEDEGYEIYSLRQGEAERFGSGGLHLYCDRLELPTGIAIPVGDIRRLSLSGSSGLLLESARGSRFEVKTIRPICAAKYITALGFLKQKSEETEEKKA